MEQYTNVKFDTYIKVVDLIKVVLLKYLIQEKRNHLKNLGDFVKDILKDKKNKGCGSKETEL